MIDNKRTIFKQQLIPPDQMIQSQNNEEGGTLSLFSKYRKQLRQEMKKIMDEGHREAMKEVVKDQEENEEKFEELVDRSQRILLKISAVFPFDLFPDSISVDETKVSVINYSFFFTKSINSIFIRDIKDVYIETSPFFATLKIVDRGFAQPSIEVEYLKKHDANQARRLIQGLVVATKEDIDCSKLETKHLREKLEMLGETKIADQ